MAETVETQVATPMGGVSTEQMQEFARFAFNEASPAAPAPAENPANPAAPEAPAAPAAPEEVVLDFDTAIKENFGVEGLDALKQQWQEYQALKANPPKPEHSFKSEQAKRMYEYLTQEKEEELYTALHGRMQLKGLDSMSEEQKIKLHIKMQNPLFDQDLIDYQFQKDYGFDESKFKDEDGNVIDPMGLKYAKIAAQQRMQNDIAKANDYFAQYKTKLELPEIKPTVNVDEDYNEYKASTAKSLEDYNNVIVPALNAIKEGDVGMAVKVEDANNQMNFDINVAIDPADFANAKNAALAFSDYVAKRFYDEKGTFNAPQLMRAILRDLHFDKYVQTAARQAVNAERKRVLEKETSGGSSNRNFSVQAPTELDELAKFAFQD